MNDKDDRKESRITHNITKGNIQFRKLAVIISVLTIILLFYRPQSKMSECNQCLFFGSDIYEVALPYK